MTGLQRLLRNCGASVWLTLALASGADWNTQKAAEFLDARQKAWIAWPRANQHGTPCISCHTTLPYLLSRPALRRALAETGKTPYETELMAGVATNLPKRQASEMFPTLKGQFGERLFGSETVLAALLLAREARTLTPEAEQALSRMWSAQLQTGPAKGAWAWVDVKLDPWESADATYYGATLAAVATGTAPGGYQAKPEIQSNIATLKEYLRASMGTQPLHNRLALLWAASKLNGLLTKKERRAIVDEARACQQQDGGWTLESLGPWQPHENAPKQSGSNGYATAFAAFALRQDSPKDSALARAAKWLKANQDPTTGSWPGESMNKQYEPESIPLLFMRDAATSFAVMALLGD